MYACCFLFGKWLPLGDSWCCSVVTHGLVWDFRVGRQMVNIPSFLVRVDSEKHIDYSLTSPFGGGKPGRVAKKSAGGGGGDAEEED